MNPARNAVGIARLALLRLTRDRVALFFTFALPLMIIALLSASTRGNEVVIGVAAPNASAPLTHALVADLEQRSTVKLRTYPSGASVERAVRLERIQGGVVVPAGYDEAVRAGQPVSVTLIVDPTSRDAAAVRSQVSAAVSGQAAVVEAARFASDGPAGFDQGLALARSQAAAGVSLDVRTSTAGKPGLSGMRSKDYAVVGELVLFLFLIGLTSAGDLVEARRDGTARRITASPTPTWAVVAGEGLGRYAILIVQATFIIVLGGVVFGVSWGDPVGVAMVVGAFALVGTCVSLLVGTLARSNEQATSLGPPIGIALAMLGGAMWPLEIVGRAMRTVGHVTPHAWALDAFVKLIGNGASARGVLPQVAVLLLFSAALLPLAALRLRRTIGG